MLKIIEAHALRINSNTGDLLYWGGSSSGKFTIKSAMQIIRRDDVIENDKIWNLIWSLRVQQRAKKFLWLVTHD